MKVFTLDNFKKMPWKNGGGMTTELFSLGTPFHFRISIAEINTNGPFSIFPGIDRTLILLNGTGINLLNKHETITVDKIFTPIKFSGDDLIECSLIKDKCIDFNVMVDRHFGHVKTQVVVSPQQIDSSQNKIFIFDYFSMKLIFLEKGDQYFINANSLTPIISIELYEN